MSQAAPTDADPSADITSPPTQPPHTDPGSQDVPAALAPPSAPVQPPLIPESFVLRQETTIMDTTIGGTSDSPTDQPEPPAEHQVIECDQPVSLEPEAGEEDVEVCILHLELVQFWIFTF